MLPYSCICLSQGPQSGVTTAAGEQQDCQMGKELAQRLEVIRPGNVYEA